MSRAGWSMKQARNVNEYVLLGIPYATQSSSQKIGSKDRASFSVTAQPLHFADNSRARDNDLAKGERTETVRRTRDNPWQARAGGPSTGECSSSTKMGGRFFLWRNRQSRS